MNHDYAHCADFTEKCPKKCFRAQLVRDLDNADLPSELCLSWMNFKGTDECLKTKKTRKSNESKHN